MKTVTIPSCAGCSFFLYCLTPNMEVNGKALTPGCRYCVFGRPRSFSAKAERPKVPDWCPRRKKPCELRIYDFKSVRDRVLHTMLSCEKRGNVMPEPRRYALVHEGQTELSPRDFWLACNKVPAAALIGRDAELFSIVEIDDGLRPVCFYRREKQIVPLPCFKTEIARNNIMEDDA